jgi:uncharacterized protein YbbC (DUF1343 family)
VIDDARLAPDAAPGYGWPLGERSWVNPSPNAPNLSMARCYAGTVMLEGTTLSEGRGTTRPLELFGAPDIDARRLLAGMHALAPDWLAAAGCANAGSSRPSTSTPASSATACRSMSRMAHYDHAAFRPWRLQASAFKALRQLQPDYPLWRDFAYEYEHDRLAIDLINGSPLLREWVDDRRGDAGRPRRASACRRLRPPGLVATGCAPPQTATGRRHRLGPARRP